MRPRPDSIARIIGRSSTLGRLQHAAREQDRLLARVRASLPTPLAEHCAGAVRDRGSLTLFADSPAWGSRLRYLGPALVRNLCDEGPIRTVRVRVLPPSGASGVKPRRRPARLSAENSRVLRQLAGAVSDPALRAALERLAARGDRGL